MVPGARRTEAILTLPSPSASGKRGACLQVSALIQRADFVHGFVLKLWQLHPEQAKSGGLGLCVHRCFDTQAQDSPGVDGVDDAVVP